MSRERCYVVYAPTAWDGQRQLVHNLAEGLAVAHRVLYIDPPMSPLSPVRYGFRASTWPRLQSALRRRVRTSGRLQVFSPLVLPPVQHPRMRRLSLPMLRAQIARAVAHVGFDSPIVIATWGMPELVGVAGESLRVAMIADHPSAGAALIGRSSAELEAEAAALCESSGLVCVTSASIVELLAQDGWHSEFIPAGFPADLAEAFDNAAEPAAYASLPRPLLGYTGGIDDRLDYDLILALADHYSHGSLVFVGAVSPRLSAAARTALAARANIHLLGLRPRRELPGYIRHLDVALLPYKDSLFTRYQSPMKFWEYLYAGPPIVGAGSAELRRYQSPLVNYADSSAAALAMVKQALADPTGGRAERRSFALANTWEDRATQLDALVTKLLTTRDKRAQPPADAALPTPVSAR
jgi:teichuronic acid biosynthesis glycosyltransferase TuaH